MNGRCVDSCLQVCYCIGFVLVTVHGARVYLLVVTCDVMDVSRVVKVVAIDFWAS